MDRFQRRRLLGPLLLVSLTIALSGCLKDIRPPKLMEQISATEMDALEQKGRSLLQEVAQTHGGTDNWLGQETTELILSDEWYGISRLFNMWPERKVRIKLQFANGTLDSRCTFLDGDDAGLVWGVQHYSTYTQETGEQLVFDQDGDILFILPTVQYFTAAPFRLLEAPIVLYAGESTIESTVYDLVYVTWGSLEANDEYDQYVIYIDRTTKRLAKMHYTVRDMMKFIVGTIHYDDFREVNGFLLPFSQKVTGAVTDDDLIHNIRLETVAFDTIEKAALYPDSSRTRPKH